MLGRDRAIFANGAKKTLIVVVPPFLLMAFYRVTVTGRKQRDAEADARRKSIERTRITRARVEKRSREISEQERKDRTARADQLRTLEEGRRQYRDVKLQIESDDDDGWYIDADENMCKVITKSVSTDDGTTHTISALIRLNPDGNKQIIRL